jgi:outer membrane protein OmpA-like peptidoglycan-associated protein
MMTRIFNRQRWAAWAVSSVWLFAACATHKDPEVRTPATRQPEPAAHRAAAPDKTLKGAGIGAATGAAGALLIGKRAADEILVGAAIGAVAGAGVGAYLDAQEKKLTRIPGTSVERTDPDTLLLGFDSDVLFPVGSDRPTAESLVTLGEVGDILVQYPKTAIVVQGHTDSTGTAESNEDLSERRALAVKDLLLDRGVDSKRVATIGHGELYPVASNGFEEGRRRNRRVTVLLRSKSG